MVMLTLITQAFGELACRKISQRKFVQFYLSPAPYIFASRSPSKSGDGDILRVVDDFSAWWFLTLGSELVGGPTSEKFSALKLLKTILQSYACASIFCRWVLKLSAVERAPRSAYRTSENCELFFLFGIAPFLTGEIVSARIIVIQSCVYIRTPVTITLAVYKKSQARRLITYTHRKDIGKTLNTKLFGQDMQICGFSYCSLELAHTTEKHLNFSQFNFYHLWCK